MLRGRGVFCCDIIKLMKELLSSTPDWDEIYLETHGGSTRASWEDEDVDEVESDDYSENDEET